MMLNLNCGIIINDLPQQKEPMLQNQNGKMGKKLDHLITEVERL
jgi:hypothetical protein